MRRRGAISGPEHFNSPALRTNEKPSYPSARHSKGLETTAHADEGLGLLTKTARAIQETMARTGLLESGVVVPHSCVSVTFQATLELNHRSLLHTEICHAVI